MASADLLGIDTVLRIDGRLRLLTEVGVLFQRDPYPGGHRFFLGFEGPKAEKILLEPPVGRFSPPVEDHARQILSSLSLFLLRIPRDGVVILLNSVDDLTVARGRIHITGVCSPIVTQPKVRGTPRT